MTHILGRCRRAYVALLVILLIPLVSSSQSTRGGIAGTITDSTGAVISGAKIVATQLDTGAKYQTVSSGAGVYRLPEVALGRYNVVITAPGFSTATRTGVLVTINTTSALNVALNPGAESISISVDASAPTIQSESSEMSGTISQQQIEDLPLAVAAGVGGLRSPETFAFLVPGTTGPGSALGGTAFNQNGVFLGKIAGGQTYGSETLLDGASIQRSENGSSFDETSPSIEALQEFKVTTAVPSAEFGRTTAGFESFSTKSGTNVYHGTAFTIVKNAALDGNNWYNNGFLVANSCATTPFAPNCLPYKRPQDSKFDYGGTFGGAIRIPHLYNGRDRSFFFFAWEQYRLQLGGTATSTVPTAAEKQGDYSALLGGPTSVINPCTGDPVLQNQIFDPATTNDAVTPTNPNGIPCRYPFAGNKIPTTRFSQAATKMMKGLPDPNQAPLSTNLWGFNGNYVLGYVNPNQNTTYTVRIDQQLSEKSHLFGSYSSRDNWSVHGAVNLPQPFNNQGYLQDFETHYTRIGWDYGFTPNLLNHTNLGYNRTNSVNYAYQVNSPSNNPSVDGMPNYFTKAFPTVGWDGLDQYSSWGVGNNSDNIDNGVRVNDSIEWQKGRHSFKFGLDWRHQQYSMISVNIPYISFLHSETDVAALGGVPQLQSGNSFASFELGQVDYSSQTVYNHNPRWNSFYMAGFAQDDYKVTPSLTLNLGVRYDVDVPRKEAENYTSAFSFTAPDALAGGLPGALVFGTNCHCNTRWANTWLKDIAPRVGFAYVLPGTNNKAVLRGGGAIVYGPLQYSDFGGAMQAGYTQTRSIGSIYTGPGTAPGFTPAFQLDSGYGPWTQSFFAPNTSPTQLDFGPGNPNPVGGEVIKPSFGRPSMTTSWDLQVQDELAQDLIFTLGYVGSVSQNLHDGFLTNANNIDPKDFSYGDHLNDNGDYIHTPGGSDMGVNAPYSTFIGTLGQALRPYPQYDYIAGDCCLENLGHSSYEAMTASLNRRFRQGFNLDIAYTWSKNLTDADSMIPFSYDSYRTQTQNSNDLRQEKAVSIQNIPQQLSISYLYQLPFGKGRMFLNKNSLLNEIVGGWELGAIQRYQTGQPIDFGCATGAPYFQNCFRFTLGPAASNYDFASKDYRSNKNGPNFFNQKSWFKPAYRPAGQNGTTDPGVAMTDAAFVDKNREGYTTTGQQWLRTISPNCPDGCSYAPYVFGTGIPRVTEAITGPAYNAEDFSLLKTFPIKEQLTFTFKVEAIDAFNRHRQGLPDTEPGDSSGTNGFGIPTYVDYGPRNLQLTGRINF